MKNTIYLNAKNLIKDEAKKLKRQNTDKAYIRYELNTLADSLIKQFNFHAMRETISQKQADMYANWLSNYTASVHPN